MDKKEKIMKVLMADESFSDIFEMIELGLNDFTIYDFTNMTHIMPLTNDNIKKAAKIMNKEGFLRFYDAVDEEFDTNDDYLYLYDLDDDPDTHNYMLSSANKSDIIDALQNEVDMKNINGVESFSSIAELLNKANLDTFDLENNSFTSKLKNTLAGGEYVYVLTGNTKDGHVDTQVFRSNREAMKYCLSNPTVNYHRTKTRILGDK